MGISMLQVHALRCLHATLVAIESCKCLTVIHRACRLIKEIPYAVVGSARVALLLWRTQFNCTEIHTVRSAMTVHSSVNLLFFLM